MPPASLSHPGEATEVGGKSSKLRERAEAPGGGKDDSDL